MTRLEAHSKLSRAHHRLRNTVRESFSIILNPKSYPQIPFQKLILIIYKYISFYNSKFIFQVFTAVHTSVVWSTTWWTNTTTWRDQVTSSSSSSSTTTLSSTTTTTTTNKLPYWFPLLFAKIAIEKIECWKVMLTHRIASETCMHKWDVVTNLKSCVATSVLRMHLLHAVAFSKKLRWLAQIKVITLKTQLHAVNARWKRLSQLSLIN